MNATALNAWTAKLVGAAVVARLAKRAASEGLTVKEFGKKYREDRGWGCEWTAALLEAWAAFDTPLAFNAERLRLDTELSAAIQAGHVAEVPDARFDTPSFRPVTPEGRTLSARRRGESSYLALCESHAGALAHISHTNPENR